MQNFKSVLDIHGFPKKIINSQQLRFYLTEKCSFLVNLKEDLMFV